MRANYGQVSSNTKQRGFTILELVVVIVVISIIAVVALNCYYKLLVDIERTTMEQDLSAMRAAISMQVVGHFTAGNMPDLIKLVDSNPMDLLAEKPGNYLGEISHYRLDKMEKGSWFYDSRTQTLIYLVRNQTYFDTDVNEANIAQFKIVATYADKRHGDGSKKYIYGLTLKALKPYRWLRPWG